MKKIWIINHYATTMYNNQGGRHFWFAKYLKLNGYQPIIICANAYHNSKEFIDTKNEKFTIKTCNTDNISLDFIFVKTTIAVKNDIRRLINIFVFYKNLFPVLEKLLNIYDKPDIILASSVHPLTLVAGIKIANKLNIPCICEIRDLWPEAIFYASNPFKSFARCFTFFLTKSEYWIYKKADALIFTKEGDIDYIKEKKWDLENGGEVDLKKVFYINNGVDLDDFNQSILKKTSNEKFTCVYTGSIRPINNVELLVDTADYLKEYNDIEILVYGDGFLLDTLIKKLITLGLTNIKFMGNVNKQDIPTILSNSSLNIDLYPKSNWNWKRGSSSNKLFEYLAAGKPIVSSCKMKYSIIDKYKCGIELEKPTPRMMGEAILKIKNMHKDDYDEYGINAKIAATHYDFKLLTKKLITIVAAISDRHRTDGVPPSTVAAISDRHNISQCTPPVGN